MSLLLDTNILTRSAQPGHPMHQTVLNAVSILKTRGEELCVAPQNLIEFWAVATRPLSANGLGMTGAKAQAELGRIKGFFRFLPDAAAVYQEWEKLVVLPSLGHVLFCVGLAVSAVFILNPPALDSIS